MIILITNRNLHVSVENEPVLVTANIIGQHLGNKGIYCAHVLNSSADTINIYPQGQEQDLFNLISAADRRKPWVFFTHGNNQNTRKNIKKCKAIEDNHGANVIAFSWPSQPYMEQDKFTKLLRKHAKRAALYVLKLPVSFSGLGKDAALLIKDYYVNYKQAQKNAVDSAPDLNSALQLTNRLLYRHLPANTKKVFLTHSLGHIVLQTFVESGYKLPTKFDNTILHQADADSDDHHKWVPELLGKSANLYITANQYDFVLASSRIANGEERLGQTKDFTITKKVKYIDFSDGAWVYEDHNFFTDEAGDANDDIFALISRLLKGGADGLPDRPYTSRNGFSRTVKSKQVYRLQMILDPTGDGDSNDDDQFMPSL